MTTIVGVAMTIAGAKTTIAGVRVANFAFCSDGILWIKAGFPSGWLAHSTLDHY